MRDSCLCAAESVRSKVEILRWTFESAIGEDNATGARRKYTTWKAPRERRRRSPFRKQMRIGPTNLSPRYGENFVS